MKSKLKANKMTIYFYTYFRYFIITQNFNSDYSFYYSGIWSSFGIKYNDNSNLKIYLKDFLNTKKRKDAFNAFKTDCNKMLKANNYYRNYDYERNQ